MKAAYDLRLLYQVIDPRKLIRQSTTHFSTTSNLATAFTCLIASALSRDKPAQSSVCLSPRLLEHVAYSASRNVLPRRQPRSFDPRSLQGQNAQAHASWLRSPLASATAWRCFGIATEWRKNILGNWNFSRAAGFSTASAAQKSSSVPGQSPAGSVEEISSALNDIQLALIKRREDSKDKFKSRDIVRYTKSRDGKPEEPPRAAPSPTFRPSEHLPQSPVFRKIIERDRPFKARPSDEAHRKLSDDPYAKILASPIRACQATGVRLPREFLVGWNILRHPERDLNSLVPTSLSLPEIVSSRHQLHLQKIRRDCTTFGSSQDGPKFPSSRNLQLGETPTDSEQGEAIDEASDNSGTSTETNPSSTLETTAGMSPESSNRGGVLIVPNKEKSMQSMPHWKLHPLYLLPQLSLMTYLTTIFGRRTAKGGLSRLTPLRWKAVGVTDKQLAKVSWRSDMAEFLPRLMRLRVLNALKTALTQEEIQDTHVTVLRDIEVIRDHGAVVALPEKYALLWIGQRDDTQPLIEVGSVSLEIKDRVGISRKVPVFNGLRLMGSKMLTMIDMLESRRYTLHSGLLLLNAHTPQGARLITELWRLNGYFNYDLSRKEHDGQPSSPETEQLIKHITLHDVKRPLIGPEVKV